MGRCIPKMYCATTVFVERYEYYAGEKSRFWEIAVEGKRFEIRYGNVGSSGRTLTKTFESHSTAQVTADIRAWRKVAEGYTFVEPISQRPELLEKIFVSPQSVEAKKAYGAWLEEKGDPRGKFITLSCTLAADPKLPGVIARKDQLLASHKSEWLGEVLGDMSDDSDYGGLYWEEGFIVDAMLAETEEIEMEGDYSLACRIRALLASEAVACLATLTIHGPLFEDWRHAVAGLTKSGRFPALKRLTLLPPKYYCDVDESTSLEDLWDSFPNLEELIVQVGHFDLGKIAHQNLKSLELAQTISKTAVKQLVTALPKLVSLTVNRSPDLLDALLSSKLVSQLENVSLYLSLSEVKTLFESASSFTKLERLSLYNLDARSAEFLSEAPLDFPVLQSVLLFGDLGDKGPQLEEHFEDSVSFCVTSDTILGE